MDCEPNSKPQDATAHGIGNAGARDVRNINIQGVNNGGQDADSLCTVNATPRVIIRTATSADIPFIQHVARNTWADTYRGIIPEIAQAKILDRAYSTEALSISIGRGQAFLVAEVNGDVAAYVDVDFDGRQMNLHRLYVSPNQQRLGLGARLLQAAIDEMLRKTQVNCCVAAVSNASNQPGRRTADADSPEGELSSPEYIPLVAHVERDNPKARSFYKKIGFAEGKEENVVIGGISLPVIQITKLIAPTL